MNKVQILGPDGRPYQAPKASMLTGGSRVPYDAADSFSDPVQTLNSSCQAQRHSDQIDPLFISFNGVVEASHLGYQCRFTALFLATIRIQTGLMAVLHPLVKCPLAGCGRSRGWCG